MRPAAATEKQGSGVAAGTGDPGTPANLPGILPPRRRRWRRAVAGVVVGVAVVGTVVIVVRPFGGRSSAGSGSVGLYQTATATVTQGTLTSRVAVDATLGHAGSYNVVNRVQGTYTAVPAVGQLIRQGQVMYDVNQSPVVLLYGQVPAYRDLSEGTTGADVRQLNADLVALGYATAAELDPSSDYFSAETAYAVEQLQAHIGVSQTGSVSLGQVVFLPSAILVTAVPIFVGAPTGLGSLALTASSTIPQVIIDLDATEQSYVQAGDEVTITLPDLQTTPGVVTSVGTVASAASPGSGSAGATIPVQVKMLDPAAAGRLDQAPVQVSIVTASVPDALAVPVTALLATTSGGYQVEVAGPGGRDRFVPVSLGLFDDAAGLVQVTGRGLVAGQRVVEAQT